MHRVFVKIPKGRIACHFASHVVNGRLLMSLTRITANLRRAYNVYCMEKSGK